MKYFALLIMCVFVGVVGWRIGGELSPDALGMAVGMLFGVMAGIPTALLMLASQQRRDDADNASHQRPRIEPVQPPAPVTNNYITNNYYEAPGRPRDRRAEIEARNSLPGPAPEMPAPRQFRIINQEVD